MFGPIAAFAGPIPITSPSGAVVGTVSITHSKSLKAVVFVVKVNRVTGRARGAPRAQLVSACGSAGHKLVGFPAFKSGRSMAHVSDAAYAAMPPLKYLNVYNGSSLTCFTLPPPLEPLEETPSTTLQGQ